MTVLERLKEEIRKLKKEISELKEENSEVKFHSLHMEKMNVTLIKNKGLMKKELNELRNRRD